MGFADNYLSKRTYKSYEIKEPPTGLLSYVVIVPAFCEPEIGKTIASLVQCAKPNGYVEVIVLINYPANASPEIKAQNQSTFNQLQSQNITSTSDWLKVHPILAEIPKKNAGVGMARKIAMDIAAERFNKLNTPNGIILSLDADSLVPQDYFTSIDNCKALFPKTDCFIFNFRHPTAGNDFNAKVYEGVALYELYLRYYKHMLQSIGFPYFHYTIGSCFAVTAENYIKHGGMSKRKAGEDFYFLQKIFPNSHTYFLKDTIVSPSARPSWRVPFGTGPEIRKIINAPIPEYKGYAPETFYALKKLISIIPQLYELDVDNIQILKPRIPLFLLEFLEKNNWLDKLNEIKLNSTTLKSFIKRFYSWFDAFLLLKFLNFASDKHAPKVNIVEAICEVFNIDVHPPPTTRELLALIRKKETTSI